MLDRLVNILKLKKNQTDQFQGQRFMQIKKQIILIYHERFVKKKFFSKCLKVTDIATYRKYLHDSGRCFTCLNQGIKFYLSFILLQTAVVRLTNKSNSNQ